VNARESSPKSRETFDVSLDGRQIASIVVGALVLLGIVFVLGLNVGRQLAAREAQAERGDDALAALDRPPAPPEAPVRQESLTFHDRLTKEKAPEATDAPAPAPAAPAPATHEVAAPAPAAAPAVAAAPPAKPAAAKPAPAKAAPAKAAPRAGWSVQV
jgi:DedD protein